MSTSTRKPSSIGMQKWRSIRLFSKGSGSRPWKQCISAARSCAPIRPVYRKQAATPHSTSTRPRCRASSRPYRQRCGGCASNAGPSRGQPPSGLAFHLARFRPPDRRSNRPNGRRKCCDQPILNTQEIIGFPQPRAEAAVRADRRIAPAKAGRDRPNYRDRGAADGRVWSRDGCWISLLQDPRALARS